MLLRRLGVTIAVVLSVACAVAPSTGWAQEEEEDDSAPDKLDAEPKGKIGLGLIGAELGVAVPALIGLDDAWAYIVFPIVGAAGGAVAGHFLIDDGNHAELSVVVLAAGMTLVIPTLVLAAAATAYDPEEDMNQASLGTGALRLDRGEVKWAAPGMSVLPDAKAGKLHVSGVHLSLVSGRF